MKTFLLSVFCLAICAQHINAEAQTCSSQKDLLDKADLIPKILDGASDVGPWFDMKFVAALNESIPKAPVNLLVELNELYNISVDLTNELNEAMNVASQSVKLDIGTIENHKDMRDAIELNGELLQEPKVVESVCSLLDSAISISKESKNNILGCVATLKNDIMPNEVNVKTNLMTLSNLVVQAETHAFTDEQFKEFGEEIHNFTQIIDDVLHTETSTVVKAGNSMKKCVLQQIDLLESHFYDIFNEMDDLFEEKVEIPETEISEAKAPVTEASVAKAPVATAPVATAPAAKASVATAPAAKAPAATAPAATAPAATAPAA